MKATGQNSGFSPLLEGKAFTEPIDLLTSEGSTEQSENSYRAKRDDRSGCRAMDKKIGRMESWLRRCAASCGCGAWSSALMDVECLQAEATEFRKELWAAIENEKLCRAEFPVRRNIFAAARVALLALIFVMTTGLPLSIDQEKPSNAFWLGSGSVALLTSTESEIINGLREALCKGNRGRVVFTVDVAPEQPAQQARMTGAASAKESKAQPTPAPRAQAANAPLGDSGKTESLSSYTEPREPSVEEVVSLIQVGQRALMTTDSAIKIVVQK